MEFDDLLKSRNELELLPGYMLLEETKTLKLTFGIFCGNYKELTGLLAFFCQDKRAGELMNLRNRHILEAFQKEAARLLHNYVASAMSLVDHTRNAYRKLDKRIRPFLEYQVEVDKRFKNNPLSHFMQDLRNYFLHYRIPSTATRVDFGPGLSKEQRRTILTKSSLMQYKEWSKLAKTYIANKEEFIDILAAIDDYYDLVRNFHGWFQDHLQLLYGDEIEEFKRKQEELMITYLPDYLRTCLIARSKDGLDPDNCFFEILDYAELEELDKYVKDSQGRCDKLISFIEKRFPLDDNLMNLIRSAYELK